MINNTAFRTLRRPNSYELERLKVFYQRYNNSRMRLCNILSSILSVLGVIFLASFGSIPDNTYLFFVVCALLCFAGVFYCVKSKKDIKRENNVYLSGQFAVVDGRVYDLDEKNIMPGYSNIRFITNDGKLLNGWFRVRKESLDKSTPLIFVLDCSNGIKYYSPCVFTPFMLSYEGIRLNY